MQVEELLKPFPIKEHHPLPRALLGPGGHEMIGPEALNLGFKKTLVMSTGLRGSETVHKIVESMKYHGLDVVVYDKVESNPKDYNVMDAVKLYQQNNCDSFVSIGGGSSHDACKGARISVAHDGRNVNEFEGFNKSETPKNPPHIAVSTTAGTGSETSWAYVITDTTTDPKKPHKYVAFDDASVTTLAIDDPVLYFDLPIAFTAQCGFDVLAHASEPYVSRIDFHPALGSALHAVELTAQHLRQAVWNPLDLAGRDGMMQAQYIAAQAFNSGGLGIIHSISHAVSAFYDLHHGLNNAVALPRVWAFNMPVAYTRFADIARAMSVDTRGMNSDVEAAEAGLAAAIRLLRDVGIPERFCDVKQDSYIKNRLGEGPTEFYKNRPTVKGDKDDVDNITNHVLGDTCTPGNPKECTFETVRPVVEHSFNGALDDLLG
jgi:methanol:N,N-dimethyl-4-nitrosoaniline oxidoreductase